MAFLFHNAGGTCRAGSGGTLRGQSGWVCVCVSWWVGEHVNWRGSDRQRSQSDQYQSESSWSDSRTHVGRKGKHLEKKGKRRVWVAHASNSSVLSAFLSAEYRSVRGCWQKRERRAREKGVYLEKNRVRWKSYKTIRAEEVVKSRLCVWGGSQCLYSGLVVSHETQNQRGLCDKYFLSKISCLM